MNAMWTRRYANSIALMRKKFGSLPDSEILIGRLLAECESARAYPWTEVERRASDAAAKESAHAAKNSAKLLARYLREYPDAGLSGVLRGLLDNGLSIRSRDGAKTDQVQALATILEGFGAGIGDGRPPAAMMHRFQHGPFVYAAAIDDGRAAYAKPRTCLATMLAFLVRWHALHGSAPYNPGQPMPKGRVPSGTWQIIESLCTEALGDDGKSAADFKSAVRNFLTDNPDLGFIGHD
ncbi:hypothetical protein [Oceanibaculum sp.]|uniref:hypothetical protein n=1 Tax=Oceanibaculum sp. TaxID=1903597 RepID=UPI0025875AE7|nr:hypothetical protein [Oceanibaculum sp.]MCH2393225.1 hypothetical protein [Oceanibaculum sp.]